MLVTIERTTLNNAQGDEVYVINPNVPFEAFEGSEELVVTSYARILDDVTREQVCLLMPGQKVKGVGKVPKEVAKSNDLTIKELKQALTTAGITFPSKAKREVLQGLLNKG